jgi:hypothetical protein
MMEQKLPSQSRDDGARPESVAICCVHLFLRTTAQLRNRTEMSSSRFGAAQGCQIDMPRGPEHNLCHYQRACRT